MDDRAKKKLLRHIPYGLYIVGVGSGNASRAFTGSWLTQVSRVPPVIALGIREASESLRVARESETLAVSFLDKDSRGVFEHFSRRSVEEHERLTGVSYHAASNGAPVLDQAIGHLAGQVIDIRSGFGDHALVIAQITDASLERDIPPLVMSDTPWSYSG
jgi:flavin reductase (DIM6/NTAB) family NADH-FMN oxidoreductase RutF